jgi:hypothetical protein
MPRPDAYRRRTALVVVAAALAAPAAVRGDGPAAPDLHVAPPAVAVSGEAPDDALARRVRSLRTRHAVGVGLVLAGATGFTVASAFALAPSAGNAYCVADAVHTQLQHCDRETPSWTGLAMVGFAAVTAAGAIVLFTSRGLRDTELAWRTQHPDAVLDPTPPAPPAVEPFAPYDPTSPPR